MCKLIADLTKTDRQTVSDRINRLELFSAQAGVDVRLTADIYALVHQKTRALGLDPLDTTPEELYISLLSLAKLHDDFISQKLGLKNASTSDILNKIAYVLNRLRLPKSAWTLKHSSIKRLLAKNPPKNVIKFLHYRSLESLLKRENPAVLLTLASKVESDKWQAKLGKLYKELKVNDFEIKPLEIIYLDEKRYGKISNNFIAGHHTNIVSSHLTGCILLMPLNFEKRAGLTLLSLAHGLKEINEVRLKSTFLKYHQAQPDFHELVNDPLGKKHADYLSIAGQPLHWHSLTRYYGRTADYHPQIFEPHVQAEDMAYYQAEDVLYRLEPALHFWQSLDFVGVSTPDGPISFNLIDVLVNLVNRVPFDKRFSHHLNTSVWHELYSRYLAQPSLEKQLHNQLEERIYVEAPIFSELEFAV